MKSWLYENEKWKLGKDFITFYTIFDLMKLFYELGEIFSLTCQKNYVFFVQILSPLKEISFESSFRFITIKFSHKLNAYEAKNKFRQTRAWDVLLVLTKVSKMVRFLQISKYKKLYYSFLSRSWVFPELIPSGSWVIPEWFLSPSRVYSYVSNRRVYPLIIFRNFPSYLLKYFTICVFLSFGMFVPYVLLQLY